MIIDTRLKEFATDVQGRYLEAVNEYGSFGKAAKALGASKSAMFDAITRLKKNAALLLYLTDKHFLPNPNLIFHFLDRQ